MAKLIPISKASAGSATSKTKLSETNIGSAALLSTIQVTGHASPAKVTTPANQPPLSHLASNNGHAAISPGAQPSQVKARRIRASAKVKEQVMAVLTAKLANESTKLVDGVNLNDWSNSKPVHQSNAQATSKPPSTVRIRRRRRSRQPAASLPATSVFTHLDLADRDFLPLLENRLNPFQRELLGKVDLRIKLFPQRFDRDGYRLTTSLLIGSEWHRTEEKRLYRLCSCSLDPADDQPSGRSGHYKPFRGWFCEERQFCPFCCWRKRMDLFRRFLPAKGTPGVYWAFVTISPKTTFPLDVGSGQYVQEFWDASQNVLKRMIKSGALSGAFWTEELAVASLWPDISVIPHVHCVVTSTSPLTARDVADIPAQVSADYAALSGDLDLELDTRTRHLETGQDLAVAISYSVKPANITGAYQRAVNAIDGAEDGSGLVNSDKRARRQLEELNQNLDVFVDSFAEERKRHAIHSCGILSGRCHTTFIGVKVKDRDTPENYQLTADLLARFNEEAEAEPSRLQRHPYLEQTTERLLDLQWDHIDSLPQLTEEEESAWEAWLAAQEAGYEADRQLEFEASCEVQQSAWEQRRVIWSLRMERLIERQLACICSSETWSDRMERRIEKQIDHILSREIPRERNLPEDLAAELDADREAALEAQQSGWEAEREARIRFWHEEEGCSLARLDSS